MVYTIACFVIPAVLAVPIAAGLRHLFAIFLRQGADLFADIDLQRDISLGIGQVLAQVNVAFFVLTWWAVFACSLGDVDSDVITALAVVGVVLALGVSVLIARDRLAILGWKGVLVGLLAFTGGNLPLFLLVPAMLALT